MAIEIMPLTPTIGAEVLGVDVTAAVDNPALADEIQRALLAHHVLVFRDQELDREQHKAFGRLFGSLHVHPSKRGPDAKGDPEIFTVKADEHSVRNNGGRWHADVTCDELPPLGSILHLKEAPTSGGDTLFADMNQAYETLTTPIKELLHGLSAVHDQRQDLRWYDYEPQPGVDYPMTSHPVVAAHPGSNQPVLNVNEAFTSHIEGLAPHESEAILRLLFDHVARSPALHCRVRWESGTLVFWDNRAVQHFAVWDYFPQVRRAERVTIAGADRPRPAISPKM